MVLRPPTRAIRSSCYAGRTEPALPNWPWGRLQELRTVGSWGEGVLHGITHCILRAHRFGIRSLAAQVPADSSYAKSCAKCVDPLDSPGAQQPSALCITSAHCASSAQRTLCIVSPVHTVHRTPVLCIGQPSAHCARNGLL